MSRKRNNQPEKKMLGEYLYDCLEKDEYLQKLEGVLFDQFIRKQVGESYGMSNKQLLDLLRFADLLSKSFNEAKSLDQKNRAVSIMKKLKYLYPRHRAVELFKRSVEAQYDGKPFIAELEVARLNHELEREDNADQWFFIAYRSSADLAGALVMLAYLGSVLDNDCSADGVVCSDSSEWGVVMS